VNINVNVKPQQKIRAFYLFFIIYELQIGVGVLGISNYIYQDAKQDAWISILISFILMLIVTSCMIMILRQYDNADILGIQIDVFGAWVGKFLGTVYVIYFGASLISIMLTYIEVIQVFLYPTIPSYVVGLLLLFLTIYTVLGGFRAVVGIAFIFLFLTQWLLLLLYDPISKIEWNHYLPLFEASLPELIRGAKTTTYTLSGFEILFFIYPFVDNKEKIKMPVFLALFYTTLVLLVSTITVIGYFNPLSLEDITWSLLTLFKNVSFSFIERLDYIVVAEWMMVVVPNVALLMWGITYSVKRLYKIRQKTTLYTSSIITLIVVILIKHDIYIQKLTDIVSQLGFWLIFIYPLVLLPIVLMKKMAKKGSVK